MLKSKDQELDVFKRFKAKVEDGAKKKIRVFRSDRGREFTSNAFKAYCEDSRIERQYTAPYTP